MTLHPAYIAYAEDGNMTAIPALAALYATLAQVERQIKALDETRAGLRDQISRIVAEEGDVVTLEGVATLRLTAPSERTTYAAKDVDTAVAELAAVYPAAAQRIAALRKVTHVAGSLRIESVKGKK